MTGEAPTSFGLSERLERVLAYPLLWVSGLFFFLFERRNRNVQMHARQSLLVFGPWCVAWWIVGVLGSLLGKIILIGWLFALVFGLLGWLFFWGAILLAVWLMVMAWFRPNYRLPFVSKWL